MVSSSISASTRGPLEKADGTQPTAADEDKWVQLLRTKEEQAFADWEPSSGFWPASSRPVFNAYEAALAQVSRRAAEFEWLSLSTRIVFARLCSPFRRTPPTSTIWTPKPLSVPGRQDTGRVSGHELAVTSGLFGGKFRPDVTKVAALHPAATANLLQKGLLSTNQMQGIKPPFCSPPS